jgi:lipopolysaccharide biosynthesis glycosyltransferase
MEKLKVFIGSGEASVIERKVLIHSIRKNTTVDVDICVFNGTHDSLEVNDQPPVRINMSLRAKYKNFTEFSNYRFLIPQLCNHKGRAMFIDSDTICLGDLKELVELDMQGKNFLAKSDAYKDKGSDRWALSVMLIDCEKTRFDLEKYLDDVDEKKYSYTDLHQLSPAFQKFHPFNIGKLDSQWNDFDHYDARTKIIHYTNLYSQPWKSPGHKHGRLWFDYFKDAVKSGFVTEDDINKAILRWYVRKDLRDATNSGVKFHFKELLTSIRKSVTQR